MVRAVIHRVLGKGLELLLADGGRCEINGLFIADNTAIVGDSELKLCRLVSEFGRVCERRKFRMSRSKRKIMRCLRNVNVGQMPVRVKFNNGEPFEEVHCFKYLGSQVEEDGGWRM